MLFRKFRQKWREEKDKIAFKNGYNYAAGEMLSKSKTPIHLDAEQSGTFEEDYCSFDRGIDAAIDDAVDLGYAQSATMILKGGLIDQTSQHPQR